MSLIEKNKSDIRVAVVQDWLVVYSGAERVLEQILLLYPQADVFALVDTLEEGKRGFLNGCNVKTSFFQKFSLLRKNYRTFLNLMPIAVEQFDLSEYDLVISSSHAVAKGVITGPNQLHVCYCHSPMRYAWDLQHQYLKEANLDTGIKGMIARFILHKIRIWDFRTSAGVDCFAANSCYVKRRVKKFYNRDSSVVYPPVNLKGFNVKGPKEDFYLIASRMVPYKKIPLIAESFSRMPEKKLVIIGDGPEFDRVKKVSGPNVTVIGHQPFEVLLDHMQRAKAFIVAAEEDFGIATVEAQACGTPVIAFGRGGSLEIVRGQNSDTPTGVFFYRQKIDEIVKSVQYFEENRRLFEANACRKNAERFSTEIFLEHFSGIVTQAWQDNMGWYPK